ncbi:hypothetical protein PTTG_29190, partial [Puccinia triticina 1-1 BBBD Race 1]
MGGRPADRRRAAAPFLDTPLPTVRKPVSREPSSGPPNWWHPRQCATGQAAGKTLAYKTARLCLIDTLGCGLKALCFPTCLKLLGPVVEGTLVPNGTRVPGTVFVLDPIREAFNIGTMIQWLDYNDCFLAAEWGHPSDNLGLILSLCASY